MIVAVTTVFTMAQHKTYSTTNYQYDALLLRGARLQVNL